VRYPELLADLPDDVCRLLRIDTTSRAVMIDHATVSHIFERRSFRDAAKIVGVLARGTFNPVYCGREVAKSRSFFIVELPLSESQELVRIVLKHVTASTSASTHDEIWVTTAHSVEDSTLSHMLTGTRFVMYRTTRGR
jgi:hypothetical protein